MWLTACSLLVILKQIWKNILLKCIYYISINYNLSFSFKILLIIYCFTRISISKYSNCLPKIRFILFLFTNFKGLKLLIFLTAYNLIMGYLIMNYWTLTKWIGLRQRAERPGFNPRSNHTKDPKNGTWCLLA